MADDGHALLREVLRLRRRSAFVSALGGISHQACEILVPVVVGVVVQRAIEPSDGGALALWLVVLVALFVVLNLSYRVQLLVGMRGLLDAEHDLRMAICRRVLDPAGVRLPAGMESSGALLSVSSGDAQATSLVLQAVSLVAGAVSALTIATIVLLTISVPLGVGVLIGSPLVVWLLHRASQPLHRQAALEQARAGDASAVATDLVRGARVLQGIGAQGTAARRYREVSDASRRATVRAAAAEHALDGVNVLIAGLFLAVVAYVGTRLAAAGTISVGELVAAVGLTQFLIGPLQRIGFAAGLVARSRASASRAAAVLRAEPALTAASSPAATAPTSPGPGALTLRLDGRPLVSTAPGEHVGVVIEDVAVAARVVDVLARRVAGEVTVDGVDLGSLPLADHHRLVLVADHDAVLFEGTVAENVAALAPGRDLGAVLAASAADEVVAALPGGEDAPVGDGGGRLSGGQRQRVALARALAADAPVLVLHEPTTAVDPATEARIAVGIHELRRGRTTVVIAASPALLARCDRVVLVRDGAAAASGRHDELLAREAEYREVVLA